MSKIRDGSLGGWRNVLVDLVGLRRRMKRMMGRVDSRKGEDNMAIR